jgi:hypothetical protein
LAHCAARHRLLLQRRASGCLGTSRGSSSTTSPTPHVWVPRLVTRLVVDYYSNAARPGASAHRAAHRRLLHLRRTFGCLGSSRCLSSTTSPTPRVRVPRHVPLLVTRFVVDYFDYAARPGASARRAACRAPCRRLLRLCRTSGCLGTSRDSSHGSSHCSSSTSPMPCVRMPRHVAWPVVDFFAYTAHPGASTRRADRHAARRRLLRVLRLRLAATLDLLQPRRASRLVVSRQHWLYFEYVARYRDIIFRSHRVDHSSQLVFQTSRERQSRPQELIGINSD